MNQILTYLFSSGGYTPHGFCLAWDPAVLYTHVFSDVLITLSYFSIPIAIFLFVRRRPGRYYGLASLFALFILFCGLSHAMAIVTLYQPLYGLQGVVKALTGIVSLITAFAVWRLFPILVNLPSLEPYQQSIDKLAFEVERRKQVEVKLAKAEAALRERLEEVEETNRQLSEFAYASSHDLNAPANTRIPLLDDLEKTTAQQLDDTSRETLGLAKQLVDRMRTLIEDILSYARVVNSSVDDKTEVDLDRVFHDAIDDLRSDINQTGAEVDIDKLSVVQAIPTQMKIVASNLLSNALKFRDPSRRPKISIKAKTVGSPTGGPGEGTAISVADNGIGIGPEFQEQIFRMFKRLHLKDEIPGTGLGLTLCHRVALSHGGTVEVSSTEGQGSTFTFTLPHEAIE